MENVFCPRKRDTFPIVRLFPWRRSAPFKGSENNRCNLSGTGEIRGKFGRNSGEIDGGIGAGTIGFLRRDSTNPRRVINSRCSLTSRIDSVHGKTLFCVLRTDTRAMITRRKWIMRRLSSTLDLRPPELFENYFELSD